MTKNRYSREFENQALTKVRERADKSVGTIAQELGMSEGTLRKWVTNANRKERAATPTPRPPHHGSPSGRPETGQLTHPAANIPRFSMNAITSAKPAWIFRLVITNGFRPCALVRMRMVSASITARSAPT